MTAIRTWAALAVATALVAGCGSPLASPAAAAAHQRQQLALAACMRAHGVPDFPDPRNGSYQEQSTPTRTVLNGVTLKESQGRIRTAQTACQRYADAGQGGGAPNPQVQKAALAFAQCMRTHGVPDFPDPKVTGHSVSMAVPASVGQSPNFQAARRACRPLMARPGGR